MPGRGCAAYRGLSLSMACTLWDLLIHSCLPLAFFTIPSDLQVGFPPPVFGAETREKQGKVFPSRIVSSVLLLYSSVL